MTAVNAVPPVPSNMPGRMFPGQSILWNASNIPAGSPFGATLLDFDFNRPGLPVPGIAPPGCMPSTGLNPVIYEVFAVPGPTVTGTLPLFVPPGFDSVKIYAQFTSIKFSPSLELWFSNTLRHTIGRP